MMKQKYTCDRVAVEIIAERMGIIAERIIQANKCPAPAKK